MFVERRFSTVPSIAPKAASATAKATVRLTGYAAVFNKETIIGGFYREKISPGAFRDALGRDDVRALFNHDPNVILGRTANRTLTLSEDAKGLRYEIVVNPDDSQARDVVARIKRGDVTGSSFSFTVREEDEAWTFTDGQGKPLKTILRVRQLIDVSPVVFPAYVSASASVV